MSARLAATLAAVALAAAGCGPQSCPAGEVSQDTVVTVTHCAGSVSAPASLSLVATIPDQCLTTPDPGCAFINQCLETASPCARICLELDQPGFTLGISGLPIAGPVTLPDPRVQIAMGSTPPTITGGTLSVSQNGTSASASFDLTFTTSDGSSVSITGGRYSIAVHHETQCGPL
jgi:hypothetical protein